MDKFSVFMNGFWGGVAVGIVLLPALKYVLNRFGGPTWEAIKKIAYGVWEDVKGLVSKFKIW